MVLLATYATIEYLTAIPKLIEISLFWILGVKIYRSKRTKLNTIYAISFFIWTLYTMSDLIMWITAANSPTWLIIDNVIRDIQVISAVIFAFLIYFSTQIVVKGYNGLNWKQIYIMASIFLMIAVLVALVDRLDVYDANNQLLDPSQWDTEPIVVISPNMGWKTMILMGIPLILYVQSVIALFKLIRDHVDDVGLKYQMYNLIVGIALIPIGILYFAVVLSIPNWYNIVVITIGRSLWIAAPIFIWRSQQKK
ncbi:MAG: hypothetical protein E4G98_01170 [Promethearchaeota archaeon]|nr:MAG: hypothetical protein E4G98_01170 [Candidatus Lokiarchaeota archaeon]